MADGTQKFVIPIVLSIYYLLEITLSETFPKSSFTSLDIMFIPKNDIKFWKGCLSTLFWDFL